MLSLSSNFYIKTKRYVKTMLCFIAIQNFAYSQGNDYKKLLEEIPKEANLQKYEAAKYIIENVSSKSFYDGKDLENFDKLFTIMEEMQKRRRISNIDKSFQSKMDSLITQYGDPGAMDIEVKQDSDLITKAFIIENLEYAFKVRNEKSWLKNISENSFYEYILPYRVGTERLEEHQRAHLYNTYNFTKKATKSGHQEFDRSSVTSMLKFAADVQKEISKKIHLNLTMWGYSFDIPISKMERGKQGACSHLVNYTTAAMRAVGLPVASDFTLRWGNNWTGHKWNVLILENQDEFPFDAGSSSMSFSLRDRKVVKVYREKFASNKKFIPPPESDVPSTLSDAHWTDVTKKYTRVTDITLNIPKVVKDKKTYVLIGTFDNVNWAPQFFAEVKKGRATFREMGVDNVYIGMYYDDDIISTFGDPFTVDSLGKLTYFSPSKKLINQNLIRKYPRKNTIVNYEKTMIGGRFEYFNNVNNVDDGMGYTIKDIPDSVVTISTQSGPYRFVKYTFPNLSKTYIAEISIVKNGKPLNIIPLKIETDQSLSKINDRNINTYYLGKKGQSIIYDLGQPTLFESIKFAPRSDSNFLVEGHEYELCYWGNSRWISLGRTSASSSKLKFSSVPENAIYLLHDLTKGKEERIFSYEEDRQIWW